jgi:hypothetical protein
MPPQMLPELPPPRPIAPAPPVVLPAPSPRALVLAKLAAESNRWKPACEPAPPTKGLWGDLPPSHHHSMSWQECWMAYRDFLGWCYTRPHCAQGMHPASDASAWDWLTQWWPRRSQPATGADITGGTAGERGADAARPPRVN